MWKDEIVEEIHRIRDVYAARFNYDIAAMVKDVQERQFQRGHEVVALPSKPVEQSYVLGEQPKVA